jgi:hypothetical protein
VSGGRGRGGAARLALRRICTANNVTVPSRPQPLASLPHLPACRQQQEKGVITGAAVRYRTDDRVGTVSAAQVRCGR